MNLPNKITITRIILTFAFMACLFSKGLTAKSMALGIFVVAAISDYLDGLIAKKFNITSDFGKIMDPVADKILTIAAFMAFVEMKLIPAWMVVVIVLRELLITSIRLRALASRDILHSGWVGKYKTFSQMFSIFVILAFLVIREAGGQTFDFWTASFEYRYRQFIFILMLITVALTIVSGVSYLAGNKSYLLKDRKA
jgi:CDP-diacylglycerol---glycerol-3-phosphate 3-phosphatidyltransferase